MNSDYIPVDLIIPKDYYIKPTEKALCFKLWGNKFLAIPRKFIVSKIEETPNSFSFRMPAWYIAKNGLRSFVEDVEIRDRMFPTKTMLKQREQLERERPLLKKEKDESELIPSTRMVEPVEKTKEAKPIQGTIPF